MKNMLSVRGDRQREGCRGGNPWEAMWGRPPHLPGACNIFELSPQMSPDLPNGLE